MSDNPFHVFICYSSKDEPVARAIVEHLESAELKCWISLRDVPPGHNYQETIVEALEQAKAIVFLFSQASGGSGEIKKELSLAGALNLPVFPLRLTEIAPTGALRYELATRQWIDLFPNREAALDRLAATMHRVLDAPQTAGHPRPVPAHAEADATLTHAHAAGGHAGRPHAPVVAAGSPEFNAVRTLLAHHIGPIARVLIEKEAGKADTPDEFCERLAAHVHAPAERAAFLKAARIQLAIKP